MHACMSPDHARWEREREREGSRGRELTCCVYWITVASLKEEGIERKRNTGMKGWEPAPQKASGMLRWNKEWISGVWWAFWGRGAYIKMQQGGGELEVLWGRKVSPHIVAGRQLMHYWFLPPRRFPRILSPLSSTRVCQPAWTLDFGPVFQAELRIRARSHFQVTLNSSCHQQQRWEGHLLLLTKHCFSREMLAAFSSFFFRGHHPQAANHVSLVLLKQNCVLQQ